MTLDEFDVDALLDAAELLVVLIDGTVARGCSLGLAAVGEAVFLVLEVSNGHKLFLRTSSIRHFEILDRPREERDDDPAADSDGVPF